MCSYEEIEDRKTIEHKVISEYEDYIRPTPFVMAEQYPKKKSTGHDGSLTTTYLITRNLSGEVINTKRIKKEQMGAIAGKEINPTYPESYYSGFSATSAKMIKDAHESAIIKNEVAIVQAESDGKSYSLDFNDTKICPFNKYDFVWLIIPGAIGVFTLYKKTTKVTIEFDKKE